MLLLCSFDIYHNYVLKFCSYPAFLTSPSPNSVPEEAPLDLENYAVPAAEARALFEVETVRDLSADLHEVLTSVTVDVMADAARKGIARLNAKSKGSLSYDRKHKSLRERWLSRHPKQTEDDSEEDSEKVNAILIVCDKY